MRVYRFSAVPALAGGLALLTGHLGLEAIVSLCAWAVLYALFSYRYTTTERSDS